MDRNSIIGFVLIAAILVGYTWYTMPTAEEVARDQRSRDSVAQVDLEQRALEAERALREEGTAGTATEQPQPAATISAPDTIDPAIADSLRQASAIQRFGAFTPSAEGVAEEVVIENERMQVGISTKGARPTVIRLKEYTTYHDTPLYLADPDSGNYEFRFFLGNLDLSTNDLYFTAERNGPDAITLKAATNEPGQYLQIDYRLDETTWFMHVDARFVGMEGQLDLRNLLFNWELTGPQQREAP
jgi:YidC/Oxa1 family membrane protein insertase